jgi:hypothetical protein
MQNLKDNAMKLREDNVTLVSINDQAIMLDITNRCSYDPNETAFFYPKADGGRHFIRRDENRIDLTIRYGRRNSFFGS